MVLLLLYMIITVWLEYYVMGTQLLINVTIYLKL